MAPLPEFLAPDPVGTALKVFVQPRAAVSGIAGVHGGALKLKVSAPPLDDRANRAVEELVATKVGVAPARVTVVAGRRARNKRILIDGVEPEAVARVLEGLY